MLIQEAYEQAVHEINALAHLIKTQHHETSGGLMSLETAKEMARNQWLLGHIFALKHKKKITVEKETKETTETKEKKNATRNTKPKPKPTASI